MKALRGEIEHRPRALILRVDRDDESFIGATLTCEVDYEGHRSLRDMVWTLDEMPAGAREMAKQLLQLAFDSKLNDSSTT